MSGATGPFAAIEPIARTLLYEGYVLFPYAATSLKNRLRASFGELAPRGRVGRDALTSETIVTVDPGARLTVRVAFLQPIRRALRDAQGRSVETIESGQGRFYAWQEAREIARELGPISFEEIGTPARPLETRLVAERLDSEEPIADAAGVGLGSLRRTAAELDVRLDLSIRRDAAWPDGAFILSSSLRNATALRDLDPELDVVHSAHIATHLERGAFASVIDPPALLAPLANACESDGAWPVLVGAPPSRSTVLHSPIIVNDYPEIAPESPEDMFDGTENDELLTLSILSLSDAEKRAMAATDPRAAALLARIEERHGRREGDLHGAVRALHTDTGGGPRRVRVGERFVGVGDGVRLRPSGRDVLDAALAGARATIVDVQVDTSGREHAVVVLEDDPGRDFGLQGWGAGHRLFVDIREIEP